MSPIFRYGWIAALGLLTASAAQAAQPQLKGAIGGGAAYWPKYLGSDDYHTTPWPTFNLTYGDAFFASLEDGIGWNVIRQDKWRVAPFIGYALGRENEDDIKDLDDVDGGATAGLRVNYNDANWRYSASAQTPFTGDLDGYRIRFKADYVTKVGERAAFTIGPRFTYTSADWADDLFSVSNRESARSGIDAYDANDGYFSAGLATTYSYYVTRQWSVTGLLGVTQLTGDAADSPIVDDIGDSTQFRAGLFINYHF
ncbi:MipA/OmpV family protein [Salinicola halimionae]|uniref:MipA/OmpV family protein n=1 Tax=Salinicola halimionae TaxID=1949081 RepID=UPI000DA1A915|nr:MipA/OmpV family protein [Salinicola halimionae]